MRVACDDGDACVDLMHIAGKHAEHLFCFSAVSGFAKNFAVQDDGGVRAEDDVAGMSGVQRLCFFECDTLHVICWDLSGKNCFINVSGKHIEGESSLRKKLTATR